MPCLYLKRHNRAVTNVLFCCRHSDPSGEQLLFLTRILAITITMWITFRESSDEVMPCIVVIIYVLPRERVHTTFCPRRATKAVSRSIRKRPCCQQSAGCSNELLKYERFSRQERVRAWLTSLTMSTIGTFVT